MLGLACALLVVGALAHGAEAESRVEARRTGVPILMYHVLADPPPGAPHSGLWVSPGDFRAELRWLASHGYRAVTLRQVHDHWRRGRPLPPRPIVLSFDDGFRSHVRVALPALLEHGWAGVLNLTVSHLAPHGDLRASSIRRLVSAGWEIDSHSLTHPDLTAIDDAKLRREVRRSRISISRAFDVPVDFFCYPAGRYDGRVIAAVRRAGYLGATTTEHGLALSHEPFALARVRVERSDGVAGLARKLAGLS